MRHFSWLLLLLGAAAFAEDLSFEPNRGQAGDSASFFTRAAGGPIFFASDGSVSLSADGKTGFALTGGNSGAKWEASEPIGRTTSYYIGRDPNRWFKNIPHYRRLTRRNVYDGIDVSFYGSAGRLEYDFLLAPHADPARIRLRLHGARKLEITADGSLLAETEAGQVRHRRPGIFEVLPDGMKRPVNGAFKIAGRQEVSFTLGAHDRRLPLSIDPVLEVSTYFGGGGDDKIIATDGSIVVGTTTSIDVPGATLARRKGSDIFVQFSESQTLVFGGSGDDQVTSASIGFNVILVGGYTNSTDLPTGGLFGKADSQLGAWQTDYAGGASDGFLLYLSTSRQTPSGFMSYVGTPGEDRITGVTINGLPGFAAVGITNGHGLVALSPPAFNSPFQADLAGGFDGFFLTGYLSSSGFAALSGVTYLGGSDDDTLLAITGDSSGYFVTGETKSADFPLTDGYLSQRRGDSDAFVARITFANGGITLDRATLFGGSGSDRGTALTLLQNGNLVVAGATSSPDLPLSNPIQPNYGGGASDAFLAQFTADLSRLTASTYYGGSSDDEATAMTVDSLGSVFLAGWTSSSDFPVKNALQPQFGGGPDDAFLLHFDTDGSLHQATYFGGSGSDRALGLYAPGGPTVWMSGSTTSRDLPVQEASQSALAGPSDGWLARMSTNLIEVSAVTGAKDLRVFAPVWLGNAAAASSATVTVTSSDPAKVVVAGDSSQAGQSSVQLAPSQAIYGPALYVDCLVDSGGADLTLSATGYPDRSAYVSCFPPSVQVWVLDTFLGSATIGSHTIPGVGPLVLYFSILAMNPNDPSQINHLNNVTLRPGAQPITVQIGNSNPQVGVLSASTVTLGIPVNTFIPMAPGTPVVLFTPLVTGQTTISATSPLLAQAPSSQFTITVDPVANLLFPDVPVPGGFQTLIFPTSTPTRSPATLTSLDPSRLVFSMDPAQPGSAIVSLPVPSGARGVYAQALASSGDAPVTITIPGQDTVSTTIHLSSPVALLNGPSGPGQRLSLAVGQTVTVGAHVGTTDGRPSPDGYLPNPGSDPVRFALNASDRATLAVSPSVGEYTSNSISPGVTFQVRGLADGTSALTLQSLNSIPVGDPVNVVVKTQLPVMADIEVGKDLAATMTLTLPPVSHAGVTLTSSNPALIVLSADGRTSGQAQINLPFPSGQSLTFYVYGMAATGQAKVTAEILGLGSVTANVQLFPSGFGWSADHYLTTIYSQNPPGPQILSFALDPFSSMPVAAQALRSGVSAFVPVSSTNPQIASISPVLLPGVIQFIPLTAGETVLSLAQPAGFTTPSAHQQLTFKALAPTVTLGSTVLGKDMQAPLQYSLPRNLNLPLTVTSSDPSKLLVSTNPKSVGSASVTSTGDIYLQALDSQGNVTVTGSAPNFNSGSMTVELRPSGIGLVAYTSSDTSTTSNGQNIITSTLSPKTRVIAVIYYPGSQRFGIYPPAKPRGGLGPIIVNVTSSNPAVGTISGNPVQIPIDDSLAEVDFAPLSAGTTNVTVTQPAGFTDPANAGTLIFNVKGPSFVMNGFVLGKDTFASIDAGLPQDFRSLTTNVTVTLTSSDPSRVLLSSDAATAPAASITRTLVAGRNSLGGFYVHGLANSGTVPIQITAPGFADSSLNITLFDTAFGFAAADPFGTPVRAIVHSGPQITRIQPMALFPSGVPGNYLITQALIRPGAPDIVLTVSSSDPSTVSVSPSQIIFRSGDSSKDVTFQAVQTGTATLRLTAPPGYRVSPSQGQLPITVVPN